MYKAANNYSKNLSALKIDISEMFLGVIIYIFHGLLEMYSSGPCIFMRINVGSILVRVLLF